LGVFTVRGQSPEPDTEERLTMNRLLMLAAAAFIAAYIQREFL
jgi:hypothetical protein